MSTEVMQTDQAPEVLNTNTLVRATDDEDHPTISDDVLDFLLTGGCDTRETKTVKYTYEDGTTKEFVTKTVSAFEGEKLNYEGYLKGRGKIALATIPVPPQPFDLTPKWCETVVDIMNKFVQGLYEPVLGETLVRLLFFKGDGNLYPRNPLSCMDLIDQKMPGSFLFDTQEISYHVDVSQGTTMETSTDWVTLIKSDKKDAANITYRQLAHTLRIFLFLQPRLALKQINYLNDLKESDKIMNTPATLDPEICPPLLFSLINRYTKNSAFRRHFERCQLIGRSIAFYLMCHCCDADKSYSILRFCNIGVKYSDMSVYKLMQDTMSKWNKDSDDLLIAYGTSQAAELYAKVSEKINLITATPPFYTYAAWFCNGYVSDFSLKKFPMCAYVFKLLSQKGAPVRDESLMPGLTLSTVQMEYCQRVVDSIIEHWGKETSTIAKTVEINGRQVPAMQHDQPSMPKRKDPIPIHRGVKRMRTNEDSDKLFDLEEDSEELDEFED